MELFLSPEQQAALESQQRITSQRSGLAEEMLGRVRGELGAAPDFSALPQVGDVAGARGRAEEALYGRATSRLDPEWSRRQEQLDVQLRNQGVMPGSPMYQQQMQEFERARGEAYTGARRESVIGGGAEAEREQGMGLRGRQAALAELLQRRGWSLNEIQALLSGQQISMPQMPGFSQAGVSQPPDLLGAARSAWQAQMDRYNAQQAGLQGLFAGAGGMATLPFMF
ncbi:MAG TPA: hypothetical protein VFI16_06380 [Anaeromyxobacteraceae bacterium]|nr:hypothetical protein [Anaeromyxobacteraceae bacterium]